MRGPHSRIAAVTARAARAGIAAALGVLALLEPALAQQSAKVHRVGYLTISPRDTQLPLIAAFERGLTERGYVLGRDVVIEYRFANGKLERLQELADDLVRAKVDVIVTGVNPNVRAAQKATSSIPIVAANVYMPVEERLVQSLNRPGGNITGLTTDAAEELGKRLQLLKQAVPGVSRVATVYGTGESYMALAIDRLEGHARTLGVTVARIELRGPEDVPRLYSEVKRVNADALIGFGALSYSSRTSIIKQAAQARIPTIFADKQYVDDGALMSYGVDFTDLFRRAGGYVDRILKGAKPADLPIELPTRYVLAVNQKTAKALGITIPSMILLQANHVVK